MLSQNKMTCIVIIWLLTKIECWSEWIPLRRRRPPILKVKPQNVSPLCCKNQLTNDLSQTSHFWVVLLSRGLVSRKAIPKNFNDHVAELWCCSPTTNLKILHSTKMALSTFNGLLKVDMNEISKRFFSFPIHP